MCCVIAQEAWVKKVEGSMNADGFRETYIETNRFMLIATSTLWKLSNFRKLPCSCDYVSLPLEWRLCCCV